MILIPFLYRRIFRVLVEDQRRWTVSNLLRNINVTIIASYHNEMVQSKVLCRTYWLWNFSFFNFACLSLQPSTWNTTNMIVTLKTKVTRSLKARRWWRKNNWKFKPIRGETLHYTRKTKNTSHQEDMDILVITYSLQNYFVFSNLILIFFFLTFEPLKWRMAYSQRCMSWVSTKLCINHFLTKPRFRRRRCEGTILSRASWIRFR